MPNAFHLRDYQQQCVERLWESLASHQSALYVLPTGCGKTEIFLEFARQWIDRDGSDVLVLAHREELVFQPAERWRRKTGEYAEVEMGEFHRSNGYNRSRLTCASKDTLWREKRIRHAFPDPHQVGLIIIDEAHHAVRQNKSYQNIINYFPHAKIIGATATPDRADEQALGQNFEDVAFEYPLLDPAGGPSAIGDGWLVPIKQQYVVVEDVQFDSIRTRGGDFVDSDLERAMLEERPLMKVTASTRELANGYPTIVFTSGVAHAAKCAEQFNRYADGSAFAVVSRIDNDLNFPFVCTDNDERRRLLKRFANREFRFLVNVGCFTEGFDEPTVACISMGRPTKSRALYAQMAGRGTRVLPGLIEGIDDEGNPWRIESADERKRIIAASEKPHLVILDFVGNSKHSLVSAVDILGAAFNDSVVETARRKISKAQADKPHGGMDVVAAIEEAQREIEELKRRAAQEALRRQKLTANVKYSLTEVDPLEAAFNVLGVAHRREPAWHRNRKPTPKQIQSLLNFKIPKQEVDRMSFVQASAMLDQLIKRANSGLCTYKQAKLLSKYGYDTQTMTFEQASDIITRLSQNGWRPLQ